MKKLRDRDRELIIEIYSKTDNVSMETLANLFGVTKATISNVIKKAKEEEQQDKVVNS